MAEKIIKNPSLLPGDLDIELSGNAITAISGHPLIGTGGGTQSDYVYYPDFDETTGNIEFKLGTIDNPPPPIGGWHISGADGARGPQGDPGDNGKTPTFQIDPENAHWEWKYTDDEYWTDTHVVASGAVGPKGDEGDDGISPTVSTETIAGGNRVTFTYDTPSKTKYIDVMSGAPGAPGAEGFSPTISTTPITDDPGHPQGGTKVTVTDSTGSKEFNIWNGINGQGATVNLLEGTGIKITENGTNYTIGVSADYALKSELPDVSDMATKTWVSGQGYLKSVPDSYATKTYVNEASANALNEAESWVQTEGYLKAVPAEYATKTYANEASANALGEAETWVGLQNFATSAGLDANKQFAMTTSGWKEVQGGGSTYTPGDCIDITNNVISFDGVAVDTAEQIIAGNGTTENPLSTSAFANALNLEIDDINDAISDLATEIAALGGTIVLRGRATCQWLNNLQPSDFQTGDAYIASDSGMIWSYDHTTGEGSNVNVAAGDMVVLINYNNNREVAVLSTTPDLDTYAQKTELPVVEAGANVVVTETTMSTGAKKYTVASLGGGGSSDMAYLVNSNDPRISVTQTYTPSPECKTFTLSANMPQFEAVTAMPSTTTPNTYYFVYEE